MVLVIMLFLVSIPFGIVRADKMNRSDDINALNQTIEEKKGSIEQIERQIEEYEKKIKKKSSEKISLIMELELIQNRIAKTELDIEQTNTEVELVYAQLRLLEKELEKIEVNIDQSREHISGILREIQINDHAVPLQILFATESFSQFFDQVDQLETINADLQTAIKTMKASRAMLEEKKTSQEAKFGQLNALQISLEREIDVLNNSTKAKEILISQTQKSEAEFQVFLRELKQEQQYIDQQINALQLEIEDKLSASDEVGDSSVLSWPMDTNRGVSAYFQDPTYPFRYLFEHSGIDLPASTGTPVKAVAPGYVAWTKKGRQYGNYVMIIHANGVATLYAHLSRIDVQADEFVSRGKIIGGVGSTGLSTGPHLHLEVRKNGIPTNPLNYLIAR